MRRLGTPLVVAALIALAVVAALDAVESGEQPPAQALESAEPLPQLPRDATIRLLRAGVRGTIGYSDSDCGRHELALPGLSRRDFLTRGCDVFSRQGNLGIEDGSVAWYAFPGGTTALLTRDHLDAVLGQRHRVRDVAWLGGTRFAALIAQPERRGHMVAIFDRDRLERVVTQVGPTWNEVRASARGSYFAVLHPAGGLAVYDRDGDLVGPPRTLRLARSIAWSPDEQWAALVTRRSLWIVRSERALTPLVQLPLGAVDVDWRRTPE
jgi:hypothetical protein